jgi:hypothetical protein
MSPTAINRYAMQGDRNIQFKLLPMGDAVPAAQARAEADE